MTAPSQTDNVDPDQPRVRFRPRPVPRTVADEEIAEKGPVGIDVSDGLFWAAQGTRRLLGRYSMGGGTKTVWVFENGSFVQIGTAATCNEATDMIVARKPLWDGEPEAAAPAPKRRARNKESVVR